MTLCIKEQFHVSLTNKCFHCNVDEQVVTVATQLQSRFVILSWSQFLFSWPVCSLCHPLVFSCSDQASENLPWWEKRTSWADLEYVCKRVEGGNTQQRAGSRKMKSPEEFTVRFSHWLFVQPTVRILTATCEKPLLPWCLRFYHLINSHTCIQLCMYIFKTVIYINLPIH